MLQKQLPTRFDSGQVVENWVEGERSTKFVKKGLLLSTTLAVDWFHLGEIHTF